MKKFLLVLVSAFSFNVMAEATLLCNDQNSHSVYKLQINDEASKVVFTPVLRDSSALSKGVATLKYNEGESNLAYSIFEGKNTERNAIVIEVRNNEIAKGRIAEVNVFFSNNGSKLDQKTIFLCEVR